MGTREERLCAANEELWNLARKVADAPGFRKSPRLREFLLFACDRALNDRKEDLREQGIGCAVFGRPANYNSSEDNIVRVEARKLRMRLEEYFASEGREEPVLIEIPKGSYVPVFTPRTVEPSATSSPIVPAPLALPPAIPRRRRKLRAWVQLAAIVILACTCFWLRYSGGRQRALSLSTSAARDALWSALLDGQHQTTIVCGDTTLVVLENFLHRSLTLEDYLDPGYLALLSSVKAQNGFPLLSRNRRYTSMADVALVAKIMQLSEPSWGRISVRSAADMQVSDFRNGNFILLGSRRAIPWSELFDNQLNFRVDFDETRQLPVIRNGSPKEGEQSEYVNSRVGEPGDSFSRVAFVPNLAHTGYVLIIAGTTTEATQASGEYLMDFGSSSALLKTLGFGPKSRPQFEVLLKSSTMAGSWKDSEIVAYRAER